ncbi:NAD(P)/FAD-dependent oxidoreductase [Jiangella endophytica]|uniref:NAD(P)/FAD-dependent oxidoreductase n=1 Tax=Jiangella endophytica TaxID=1623398 RepID=UPI0018E55BF8|nr:FAD-dependent oxidoreductase [Jiangella endophytica]
MSHGKGARVLVVGASAAGFSAAAALRRRGHHGPITLLGAERHPPYDRPPLSKQYQTHGWDAERLGLATRERLAGLDLELRLGVRAAALDLSERVVEDDDGGRHRYDQLVIATGLVPRRLAALAGVPTLELRTLEDADRLKAALRPGSRLAVVGAGFVGLEGAATARRLGADVTVVEPVAHPLADRIGSRAATRLCRLHEANGVDLRCGSSVAGGRVDGDGTVLELSDGTELLADAVLVAVGASPSTGWLRDSGLDIIDGVRCDEYSRVAESVWAAGDVARWRHIGYGEWLRVEHRTNATEQGQQVAAGIHGELTPYVPVPFFWTDHYDVRVQLAGRYRDGLTETDVELPDRPGASVTLFHAGDELRAALAWNAPKELHRYRRELLARFAMERSVA